ncbi:hypothetical protein NP233_g9530 [Leucocoprinus birnbaumii]|uniref:Cytochrome P450 n=1 Tax=Leucocoprinus birnbaumii TaxID=56174 RepID=A0AAD5VLX5_9AGAR|nr:hypothetical protein NP233_g9530 [Leucocoprinus birnbaumii]
MLFPVRTRDLVVLLTCFLVHLAFRNKRKRLLRLPPGPVRWPIIGNALMVPATYVHKFYKKLSEDLGSKIIYLECLKQPIIVISDFNIARELLEKRSALYSSRPPFTMTNEVIGFNCLLSMMPYGDRWRLHRRILIQNLSEKNIPEIREKVLDFIRKGLLSNVLQNPDNIREHLANTIGGFSLSMTYGTPVQRQRDPLVHFAEEVFNNLLGAGAPSKYMVNVIAPLKYIPEWFPGSGFKKEAKKIRSQLDHLMEEPFRETMGKMDQGTAIPCFVTQALERGDSTDLDHEQYVQCIKEIGVEIFSALFETTFVPLMTFFLVMQKYPEVQRKAQEEVDFVVGYDRLPDFSDIPHLKFISCVVKELFRWNPIVPIGVPHATTEEDVYMGYYIPKGSIVVPNSYAMLQDEQTFPEPEKFMPERFIASDGGLRDDIIDPEFFVTFGFGRRICPGASIARSTIYITIASLLHLFNVSPALDAEGKPVDFQPKFRPSSVTS